MERDANDFGPADATATPSSLASVKSRMVYLSSAGLPRKKSYPGKKAVTAECHVFILQDNS